MKRIIELVLMVIFFTMVFIMGLYTIIFYHGVVFGGF